MTDLDRKAREARERHERLRADTIASLYAMPVCERFKDEALIKRLELTPDEIAALKTEPPVRQLTGELPIMPSGELVRRAVTAAKKLELREAVAFGIASLPYPLGSIAFVLRRELHSIKRVAVAAGVIAVLAVGVVIPPRALTDTIVQLTETSPPPVTVADLPDCDYSADPAAWDRCRAKSATPHAWSWVAQRIQINEQQFRSVNAQIIAQYPETLPAQTYFMVIR